MLQVCDVAQHPLCLNVLLIVYQEGLVLPLLEEDLLLVSVRVVSQLPLLVGTADQVTVHLDVLHLNVIYFCVSGGRIDFREPGWTRFLFDIFVDLSHVGLLLGNLLSLVLNHELFHDVHLGKHILALLPDGLHLILVLLEVLELVVELLLYYGQVLLVCSFLVILAPHLQVVILPPRLHLLL